MTQDSKESVFSRWSSRKQKVELSRQAADELAKSNPDIASDVAAPIEREAEAEPVLTDADMPDIELLTEDSDYSGFMSEGVSDKLRNLALRKLFHAPVFNIRDGLDEYDEDYTHFEKLGDIVTCDMKHEIEMQEQKLREAMEQEAEVEQDTEVELEAAEVIEDETETDEQPEQEPPEIIAETELETRPKQEQDDDQ